MAVAAAVIVAASPGGAEESNIRPLLDRMERLERDIRTLNLSIARGTPLPPAAADGTMSESAVARLGLRMDRLEQDIRDATGTMEELNYRINQVVERLDKLVGDVDFRLSSLEEKTAGPGGGRPVSLGRAPGAGVPGTAAAPGPRSLGTVSVSAIEAIRSHRPEAGQLLQTAEPTLTPQQTAEPTLTPQQTAEPTLTPQQTAEPTLTPQQTAVAPEPSPLPPGTAKQQYAHVFNLLRQANYDQAEVALKAFIDTHEADPLVSNARYWLGETHYVRGAYQDAAQVFFEGFQKDPKGPKAADTLLKLGMSLAGLNKQPEACAAFSKVLADFPRASGGIKSAVSRERQRNGCL